MLWAEVDELTLEEATGVAVDNFDWLVQRRIACAPTPARYPSPALEMVETNDMTAIRSHEHAID